MNPVFTSHPFWTSYFAVECDLSDAELAAQMQALAGGVAPAGRATVWRFASSANRRERSSRS